MIEQPAERVDEWRKTMQGYRENKTKLPWGKNPAVTYVGEKDKKAMDVLYNPILQRYTDASKEAAVEQQEGKNLVQTLAKNKVSSSPLILLRIVRCDMSRPSTSSRSRTS